MLIWSIQMNLLLRVDKKIIFGRSKEYGFIWCCLAGKNAQRFDLQVFLVGQKSAVWGIFQVDLKGHDLSYFRMKLEAI